jgi:hypothetical protein
MIRLTQTLLSDILVGNVSEEDLRSLKLNVLSVKKKSIRGLLICATIVTASLCTIIMLNTFGLLDNFGVFVVVICVFTLGGMLLLLAKLNLTFEFLRAIKTCRPGSNITTSFAYRGYNSRKTCKFLFNQIIDGKLTADEATGILNLAKATRSENMRLAIVLAVIAVILAAVSFITPSIADEAGLQFVLTWLNIARVVAVIFGLLTLRLLWVTRSITQYTNAVNSTYTEEHIKQQKERIDKIVLELYEKTSVLFIRLTAARDKTLDVFSSKF